MKITPDQAARIKEANLGNVLKKVKAGKTLTAAEARMIDDASEVATIDSHVADVAPSWPKLALELGISRKTLGLWRKMKGSPPPKADGSHDVRRWKEFMVERGLGSKTEIIGDTDPVLRSRKLKAEVLQREIKVETLRRTLIPIDEVRERMHYHIGQTMLLMYKKLSNEMPPMLVGKSAVEMRKIIDGVIYELLKLLRNAEYLDKSDQKNK